MPDCLFCHVDAHSVISLLIICDIVAHSVISLLLQTSGFGLVIMFYKYSHLSLAQSSWDFSFHIDLLVV